MRRTSGLLDLQYVNRGGDTMTGPLGLAGVPLLANHAATKQYVDTVLTNLASGVLMRDGSVPMTGPLTLAGVPTNPQHASPRGYVDALDAQNVRLDGTRPMTGLLTLSGVPTVALHAATRGYVDALDLLNVRLDGTRPMTGALTLPGLPTLPLHSATKSYVDALPAPTLDTYDAVVAAAGGDYTSIVTACATEAAGARIFIKRGTYNETANIQMKAGQMLVGENPEDTIIDFGAANRKLTFTGVVTNLMVRDLTVRNSIADYTVDLSGNYATVENCRVLGTAASFTGVRFVGSHSALTKSVIDGFSKVNQHAAVLGPLGKTFHNLFINCSRGVDLGNDSTLTGNTFMSIAQRQVIIGARSAVSGNYLGGGGIGVQLDIDGNNVTISGNYITGNNGLLWDGNFDYTVITGNIFDGSQVKCTQTLVSDCTITGNIFNGGAGIDWAGFNSTISGNTFFGTAFIALTVNAHDISITGNSLESSTAVPVIVDLGTANQAKNNGGVCCLMEKTFMRMKNTSGGGLVEGDVVVFKAVAAGDEITTTVAGGDDMVYGMVEDATLANNAYGNIQTEGKTVKLKVNGTVNIAIGDLLCTMNQAGIAKKAAAADMAFAIALEVYANADSLGVIDAVICKQKKL